MATNAYEKAQVGHYFLARRDYEQAWKWYTEAERELPPAPPVKEQDAAAHMLNPPDFSFFEYYCLTKLGRGEEARAKWQQFNKLFTPPADDKNAPAAGPANNPNAIVEWGRDLRGGKAELLRDFYAAEVFLSLNAAEDAQAYFEKALKDAPDAEAKALGALVLSQVHLLRKQHVEYARLATNVLLPRLVKTWKPRVDGTLDWGGRDDSGLATFTVLALAPLTSPDFLASLPEEEVRKLLPRWIALRDEAKEDVPHLGIDLVLQAAYGSLGQDKEKQEAADRVLKNPARGSLFPPEVERNPVAALREGVAQFEQLLHLMRGI
jgi:tetratricopeptide (TPR) repeat protein